MLGLHLEGPFFCSRKSCTASFGTTNTYRRNTGGYPESRGRDNSPWDAAPELPNMDLFAEVMKRYGVLASAAHTVATAEETLRMFDAGFSHVTHFYNGTSTFHKVNGLVHSGVIEATYIRDDVTIELIADGRHIPKQSMQLAHRIKGADRIALITDGMRIAAHEYDTRHSGAQDTGVLVVVKDEVAQLTDFSSYAGSICTMDRAFRTAYRDYGLPLCDVQMTSLTPARLCGVETRKGSLTIGKDADIVVMSPELLVKHVFIHGIKKR